jgi:hypothetical protein
MNRVRSHVAVESGLSRVDLDHLNVLVKERGTNRCSDFPESFRDFDNMREGCLNFDQKKV